MQVVVGQVVGDRAVVRSDLVRKAALNSMHLLLNMLRCVNGFACMDLVRMPAMMLCPPGTGRRLIAVINPYSHVLPAEAQRHHHSVSVVLLPEPNSAYLLVLIRSDAGRARHQ